MLLKEVKAFQPMLRAEACLTKAADEQCPHGIPSAASQGSQISVALTKKRARALEKTEPKLLGLLTGQAVIKL